ncbi:MAG TPA: LysM domain-containing protein [Planctomycetota bacterium]|jgi:nucleoid-associated protein YgaU|nr:LysM domain-containing protein [Planctomycetota bacterium]
MGNLEKAGIGVVVVLLLVILVVAFMGDGPAGNPGESGTSKDDSATLIIKDDLTPNPGQTPRPGSGTRGSDSPVRPALAPEVGGEEPTPAIIVERPPNVSQPPLPSPEPKPAEEKVAEQVVKDGDSLWKICASHYGAAHADAMVPLVAEASGLTNASRLTKGQIIRLPALPEKVLVKGDPTPIGGAGGQPLAQGDKAEKPAPKKKPVRLSVPSLPFVPGAQNSVEIEVHDADTYVVAKGDSLGGIAQRLLGSARRASEIAERNGITNYDSIYEGQVLRLPKK